MQGWNPDGAAAEERWINALVGFTCVKFSHLPPPTGKSPARGWPYNCQLPNDHIIVHPPPNPLAPTPGNAQVTVTCIKFRRFVCSLCDKEQLPFPRLKSGSGQNDLLGLSAEFGGYGQDDMVESR